MATHSRILAWRIPGTEDPGSEAAVVETEVASGAAGAWTAVALVVEDEVVLGGPLDH